MLRMREDGVVRERLKGDRKKHRKSVGKRDG